MLQQCNMCQFITAMQLCFCKYKLKIGRQSNAEFIFLISQVFSEDSLFPSYLSIGYFYHLIGKMVSCHVTHIVYLVVRTKLQITDFCLLLSLPQAQCLPFVSSHLLETIKLLFLSQKATWKTYVTSVQKRSWKPKIYRFHFLFSH